MGEALILETTFLVDLEREALAAAPGRGLPLVTRDEAHFHRVPGLRVVGY